MSEEEIHKALEIIKQPITVNYKDYYYFDQENYDNLVRIYDNCLWFIRNFEQINTTVERVQQENQQLKEELKYSVSMVEHNKLVMNNVKENRKLKSVLDEIREYITKDLDEPDPEEYKEYTVDISWFNDLLQILDKVNK